MPKTAYAKSNFLVVCTYGEKLKFLTYCGWKSNFKTAPSFLVTKEISFFLCISGRQSDVWKWKTLSSFLFVHAIIKIEVHCPMK